MEKKMEPTIMVYIGTTIRIQSFVVANQGWISNEVEEITCLLLQDGKAVYFPQKLATAIVQ